MLFYRLKQNLLLLLIVAVTFQASSVVQAITADAAEAHTGRMVNCHAEMNQSVQLSQAGENILDCCDHASLSAEPAKSMSSCSPGHCAMLLCAGASCGLPSLTLAADIGPQINHIILPAVAWRSRAISPLLRPPILYA
ncbi:hypothetical protein ACFVYJ_12655 [Pontibacter sp. JAM-7]|uniref:hypothetical protein n=1 Tax=Pontibacter sp. JAM-7 TaxID=3366581 RepID=UPI003AF7F49D